MFKVGDRVCVFWDRIPKGFFKETEERTIEDYRKGSSISYGTVKELAFNGTNLLRVSMDSTLLS